MGAVVFAIKTSLSPDKVLSMLIDFSADRPQVWPGLYKGAYKVYVLGDHSSEVREGSRAPKVWAREHYDWSRPGVVRWEVVDSNFCQVGGSVQVTVMADSPAGSRLVVEWDRSPKGVVGLMSALIVHATRGRPLRRSLELGLRKAEAKVAKTP